jgi:hypothetical protein
MHSTRMLVLHSISICSNQARLGVSSLTSALIPRQCQCIRTSSSPHRRHRLTGSDHVTCAYSVVMPPPTLSYSRISFPSFVRHCHSVAAPGNSGVQEVGIEPVPQTSAVAAALEDSASGATYGSRSQSLLDSLPGVSHGDAMILMYTCKVHPFRVQTTTPTTVFEICVRLSAL